MYSALPQRVDSVASVSRIKSLFSRDEFREASCLKLEVSNPRYPPAVVGHCKQISSVIIMFRCSGTCRRFRYA